MRAGLAASTDTPGRTAPDASRTTPAIALCAFAVEMKARRISTTMARVRPVALVAGERNSCIVASCGVSLGVWMGGVNRDEAAFSRGYITSAAGDSGHVGSGLVTYPAWARRL